MDILWGMKAAASDAWAGSVVGAIVDAEHRRVTHVMVRRGAIMRRIIAVPIGSAGRGDANAVYFDMTFSDMRALPADTASGIRLGHDTRAEFGGGGGPRVMGVRMSDDDKHLTHVVLKGMIMENRLLLALEDIGGIDEDYITTAEEALEPDDLPSYRRDGDIENDAWEALFASGDLSPTDLHGIAIAVVDGRVAITGNVREREAARDIGDILRTIEGVLSVEDEAVSDRELEISITALIAREHWAVRDQLLIHCQMGRVEIGGPMPTAASLHAIMQQMRSMPGVRSVEDKLVMANTVLDEPGQEVSAATP